MGCIYKRPELSDTGGRGIGVLCGCVPVGEKEVKQNPTDCRGSEGERVGYRSRPERPTSRWIRCECA